MKSILIDSPARTIGMVDISGKADIARLVGFDTIAVDAIGKAGGHLYFDEDCFLRGRINYL